MGSPDSRRADILQPTGFPPLPAGWESETDSFTGAGGRVPLFARLWRKGAPAAGAEARARRALFVLHGMGEHGGRYLHLPHYLGAEIDLLYAPDLRGHGRSGGVRGHVERFDELAEDAALAIRRLHERLAREGGRFELHVLSHSLGSHVMLRTLLLNPALPIASANVSAPFLGVFGPVPASKLFAAKVLRALWKSLPLDTGLDAGVLSSDPAVVKAYRDDPLNHGKMTPAFFFQLLAAFEDTLSRTSGIVPPIQFLIPMEDRVVQKEKALAFYQALQHPDKALRTYTGFFHEPLNEPRREEVFHDILSWIRRHPVAQPPA